MPETQTTAKPGLPAKARVLLSSLGDILVDLLLPTAIYAILAPTRLSPVVRLAIGGYFVAAKAGVGRVSERQANFWREVVEAMLIAFTCTAVTVAVVLGGGTGGRAIALGTAILLLVQGVRIIGWRGPLPAYGGRPACADASLGARGPKPAPRLRTPRRLDAFAILVMIELAATILLTSATNDPRLVLLRPSLYTAIAGIYVMTTVWSPRPFMMQLSKPMAAGGDPVRAEAFEQAGRTSLRFRRAEQAMTAGLALVLLAESALRIAIVMSHPASQVMVASLWSHAVAIGLLVVYFAVARLLLVPRASREVDALMPGK